MRWSTRVLLAFALVPDLLAGQIRASERSTVTQIVDGTMIKLDFARPRLRDRPTIFGKVVHWNEVWTPGANWATTLEASRKITLAGVPVPKGKYSVWFVVREAGPWTLLLDTVHHRFHEDRPDSASVAIRIPVAVDTAPPVGVLSWSFPDVRVNGGTLAWEWAGRRVTMNFDVEPSLDLGMPPGIAAAYVGRYRFIWLPVEGSSADTVELNLAYENGSLYGTFTPADEYFGKFVMIRLADGGLIPGLFEKGAIYEVIREMVFEFKGPAGRPDRFEVRDDYDDLIATGTRKP